MTIQNKIGYSRKQIEEKLQDTSKDIDTLYQQAFVNYRGKTIDTNEAYTEVIAEVLLNWSTNFDTVHVISRTSGYRVFSHNGLTTNEKSNREEERIALGMFGKTYDNIGKVIDYQVPLKATSLDIGVGKIDMLSVKENSLIMLELKKENSKETLLRCVLEAITYWKKVDRDKLLSDYSEFGVNSVEIAAFVFKDSAQHEEYKHKDTYTRRLMDKLQVGLYVISINDFNGQKSFEVELP